MPRQLELASLFETRWRRDPKLAIYPTLAAHLDAARAGTKPLSAFGFLGDDLANHDPEYLELVDQAFRRGLVVVLLSRPSAPTPIRRRDVGVFVAKPEELWRIPAWVALWEARGQRGRDDATEAMESLLLGYTPAQRARWLAGLRQRAPASGRAVYALLTRRERARAIALGLRCLGSAAELQGLRVFAEATPFGIRRDAFRRVPAGLTLARFGVTAKPFAALFGRATPRGRRVVEAELTKQRAVQLNTALRDPVELLTARGWR